MRATACLTTLLLTACASQPFHSADSAARSMQEATASLDSLSKAASGTVAAFEPMLDSNADLKASYRSLVSSIDSYQSSIERVKKSIAAVEASAKAFLDRYATTREQVKDSDLRASMLMRKESIERQITDMKVELSNLLASAESLSSNLNDLRLFASANLNAQAIGQATVMQKKLGASLDSLKRSTDRVSLELKDLSASISSEHSG